MKKVLLCIIMIFYFSTAGFAEDFSQYCRTAMQEQGECPQMLCERVERKDKPGQYACRPKPCDRIAVNHCPQNFCAKMVNCRGEEICHFQMFDPPQCGNVSYAGQDVPCCEGLVRRCGTAFLDDTCDMFGDNSEYSLPICIPCGNGICNNFENVCNCPEDCWPGGDREYDGQAFED